MPLRLLLPCALNSFSQIVHFIWFRLLCCAKIYYVKICDWCRYWLVVLHGIFTIAHCLLFSRRLHAKKMFSFCYTKLAFFLFFSFLWISFPQHTHQRTCIYFTNFSLTLWCAPFFVLFGKVAARRHGVVWHGMAWHWNLFATKIKLFNGIFRTAWIECTTYRVHYYIQTAHAHKLYLSVAWKSLVICQFLAMT